MGLLCLTPATTPIPSVLKEHPGWVEGQRGPTFQQFSREPKTDAGLQKGNAGAALGLFLV